MSSDPPSPPDPTDDRAETSSPAESPAESHSADDALPPVEPPSAAFVVQLFVVPAVIVVAIVSVWTMFHWLAHVGGNDPTQYIETMRRDTPARWQAAVSLANSLRAEGSENKNNAELARQVGQLLDEEIDEASQQENDLKLRVYLAKCLGEFTVPDAVDVLLKASTTQRHEDEVEVRWAAVCSLAVMADGCENLTTDVPEVVPTLLELSSDDETVVRSATAFALGVVGDEASLARLNVLLADTYPDVRYNAATGICRQSIPAKATTDELFDVLAEMLDPDETAGIVVEEDVDTTRDAKRWLIVSNGLKAVDQLVTINPSLDVAPLIASLERLEQDDVPRVVRKAAANLRLTIEKQSPATAAAG